MASTETGLGAAWGRLERPAKLALLGGMVLIVSLAVWLSFVVFSTEYKVLFTDLSSRDAGTIVEQLKARKIKYRLEDGGATITVIADQVHDVRLQLMSSDLSLSGGVGFEIFDKQGLGATENSQRVSYQRALQGELSRTIGALENVKQVRVHLVLPESSLFRKDRQEASAAVTLTMKPQGSLQRPQIVGIQRLVAASVPGLSADRVVVTDYRGITLSIGDEAGSGSGAMSARLEAKQHIEEYITRKVGQFLNSAYGAGQAIVSVDATVSFDAVKRTTQALVPANQSSGEGLLVRKRQVLGAGGAETVWASNGTPATPRAAGSSMEMEYEYGKRMEEVITAPGTVTRLSIGVVVPQALDANIKDKIKEIVRAAAGLDEARGDVVSVQSLRDFAGASESSPEPAQSMPNLGEAPAEASAIAVPSARTSMPFYAGAVVFLMAVGALFMSMRRRAGKRLTLVEREHLLREIQTTVNKEARVTRALGST